MGSGVAGVAERMNTGKVENLRAHFEVFLIKLLALEADFYAVHGGD